MKQDACTRYASRIFLLVLLAVFAGCSTTGKNIVSSYDPETDFSQYRFFAFADPLSVDRNGTRTSLGMELVMATTRELLARGMQPSNASPDLRIDFYVAQRSGVPSNSAFVHAHSGMTTWRAYDSKASTARHMSRQITEGTLVIDVVDARRGTLVFEGLAEARVTESVRENLAETVNAAVTEIFSNMP